MTKVTETLRAKIMYGCGTVAYGVKDNAFLVFLLFYYSRVVGLSPELAGTALLIAMIADAITDPMVGQLSDNLRTRIGRRHPLMLASALPVAISFYLLWFPPDGLTQGELFAYLLTFAILTRVAITFYEIPSNAMLAEITQDYDQRVKFTSIRYFFGWIGGGGLAVFSYATFFAATPDYPNGQLNPLAYEDYALLAASLMFSFILISTLGTLRYVPYLVTGNAPKLVGLSSVVNNMWKVVTDRVYLPLFLNTLAQFGAKGIVFSLSLFFNIFYWGFSPAQIAILGLALLLGSALALVIAPAVSKGKLGKRSAAIRLAVFAAVLVPLPVVFRAFDFMPENGDPVLMYTIFIHLVVVVSAKIASEILVSAMVADVVDDNEVRVGRRNAGVFSAVQKFAEKSTSGIGLFVAGLIIGATGLEADMSAAEVTPEMLTTLAAYFVPTIMCFYIASVYLLTRFTLTREKHDKNIEALRTRAAE